MFLREYVGSMEVFVLAAGHSMETGVQRQPSSVPIEIQVGGRAVAKAVHARHLLMVGGMRLESPVGTILGIRVLEVVIMDGAGGVLTDFLVMRP